VLASRCEHEHVEHEENQEAAHTNGIPEAITIVERIVLRAFDAGDAGANCAELDRSPVSGGKRVAGRAKGPASAHQIDPAGVEPIKAPDDLQSVLLNCRVQNRPRRFEFVDIIDYILLGCFSEPVTALLAGYVYRRRKRSDEG